jgi:outer membrane protein OmpA-like peptidoglycan-associated protein
MAIQPNSFIDGVRALITPNLVSKASSALGESEATVTKGLGAALSAIFGTLASRADDRSFMSRMFDMIKDPAAESNVLGMFTGGGSESSSTSLSSRFMSTLFGGKTDFVGQALSSFAGVKPSTASSLLSLAGPLALGYLGKTVRSGGMDISSLTSMLLSQKNSIMRLVPIGISSVLGSGLQLADTTSRSVNSAVQRVTPWRWLAPVLLLLLALWALVWLLSGRSAAGFVSKSLPGGVQLQYSRSGMESKLLGFLENPNQQANSEVWFDFDRLLFETDSAVLKPESQTQLNNIAAILKAYPGVRVKIGGYTDTSGDAAGNLALSQSRADTVMQGLTRLGISADRLSAEGFGAQHPVADNATVEGRSQNRRVAIRVTKG